MIVDVVRIPINPLCNNRRDICFSFSDFLHNYIEHSFIFNGIKLVIHDPSIKKNFFIQLWNSSILGHRNGINVLVEFLYIYNILWMSLSLYQFGKT